MRNTRSLLLLSLGLFILSLALLCVLVYQYYHQDTFKTIAKNITTPVQDETRDSLLKVYNTTVNSLYTRQDTSTPDTTLKEFYKLRSEIANLLQAKSTNEDMDLARKKIGELQQKLNQLNYRKSDVENENIKLHAMLDQLTKETKGSDENVKEVSENNKTGIRKDNSTAALSTANLNLSAVAENIQNEEGTQSEKLVGSFTFKNISNNETKYDLVVVLIQPDGQVLQKSQWESGSFETSQGKKVYSCKLSFNALQGEAKQLNFSLSADRYQKGNYTMQIYHNGIMIGKMNKILS